jgi:hypothetical protein
MVRSLLMYAEARPEKEAAVAKAIVAHLLAESKLLQTDPVRARPGRLGALSVSHTNSVLYDTSVWAHRALNGPKRWFPGRQVIKWAQTRWPTFVELCQYVVDTYVPKYGGNSGVMPLGGEETTQVLLNASALFASRGVAMGGKVVCAPPCIFP